MEAYIYKADIYCASCGEDIVHDLKAHKVRDTGDSDEFPQGPYTNGGGESDTPQHCCVCDKFLANPLTGDGLRYVECEIIDHYLTGAGQFEVLAKWQSEYGIYPQDPVTNEEIEL